MERDADRRQHVERKLAAILAADIAGYSRLMGADEAGTAKLVRHRREMATPIVRSAGGLSRRWATACCWNFHLLSQR